jgi:4,5:9,10-diseco-3-hydroxy-5,9,17-trioxoandrosta-1(10),2-diene-4-oate hydrolase
VGEVDGAVVAARVEEVHVVAGGTRRRILSAGLPGAPPLLLLHGIAGSADEWGPIMPALGERFRVYAPDAPGHGQSDKPRGVRYDVAHYVDATLAVMDELGIEGAPVVALSGGGTVGLRLALERSDRVEKLVLVDAAGLGKEVSWDYRLSALPGAQLAFRRGLSPRRIVSFGKRLLYDKERLPEGWVERRQRIWASDGAVEAFFATARECLSLRGQRVSYEDRLQEIRQPVLIVWGRQDPIIPLAHGIRAAARIPDARLHVFEECGHVPHWEYPEEFVQVVVEFLAG